MITRVNKLWRPIIFFLTFYSLYLIQTDVRRCYGTSIKVRNGEEMGVVDIVGEITSAVHLLQFDPRLRDDQCSFFRSMIGFA